MAGKFCIYYCFLKDNREFEN